MYNGSVEQEGKNRVNKREIIIAILVVAVVLLLVGFSFFFSGKGRMPLLPWSSSERVVPLFKPGMTLEEKRKVLFERVKTADMKPMTDTEVLEVIAEIGDKRTAQFNFSDEEIEQIINALNSSN